MPHPHSSQLWARNSRLVGCCVLVYVLLGGLGLSQTQPASLPQLAVTDYLWSEDGNSVELKVQLTGMTQQVELLPYLRGVSGRGESKGTAVIPSAGPQTVSLTVNVPPAQRWQPLSIGVKGLGGDREATFNVPRPEGGNLYVMAVGVKTFGGPDSGFKDLDYTVADAEALIGVLQKQQGRLYRKVNTFLLTDAQATRSRVLETMQTIERQATVNDTVIALFSTHGTEQAGQYYAMLYGGDTRKFATTAITGQELGDFYGRLKSKTVLLLDTCASGGAVSGPGIRQPATTQLITTLKIQDSAAKSAVGSKGAVNEYRSWITAAQADQESLEESSLGHGLFTYAILEALQGKFDSAAAATASLDPQRQRDNVEITQLLSYVVARVQNLSAQYASRASQRHVPYYILPSTSFPVAQLNITVNVTINVTVVSPDTAAPVATVNGPAPDPGDGVFVQASGGKDDNSGAAGAPVQSLQKALELKVGSRITLAPGEYSLPSAGLTLDRPLTLTAKGSTVTLRCPVGGDGLTIRAENVLLEGLRFSGCALALTVRSGSAEIVGGEFRDNEQALLVSGGQATFHNTVFMDNGAGTYATAAVRQSGRLSFDGGRFQSNDLEAIRADGDGKLAIRNVNFIDNARTATEGGHIYLLANAELDLNGASFTGARFSLMAVVPKVARLCGLSDQTPRKTYQVTGSCR